MHILLINQAGVEREMHIPNGCGDRLYLPVPAVLKFIADPDLRKYIPTDICFEPDGTDKVWLSPWGVRVLPVWRQTQ